MTVYALNVNGAVGSYSLTWPGGQYRMRMSFNDVQDGGWALDFYQVDTPDAEVLVLAGVPIVIGADLFEQFEYLGFGVKLYATNSGSGQAPAYGDFASGQAQLYVEID